MRVQLAALSIALACVAGCLQSNAIDCGFGLCPSDRVCDRTHSLCVQPDQLESCVGKPNTTPPTPCSVNGRPGLCTDEVCLENDCGDGIVTGTEQCDGTAFVDGANDCLNVGFYDPGPIACKPDCTIDTSHCARTCGDTTKDTEEVCEYKLAGQDSTCMALGYYEDAPAPCTAFCTYDITACKTRCGDGMLNGQELCEPALGLPPYLSCVDYGFDTGIATCGGTCTADLDACHHFGVRTAGALSMATHRVWQAGPSLAYVVGSDFGSGGGLITRWNGTQLAPVAPAGGQPFLAVSGTSPTNVFAVGQNGRIGHFDGVATITDMASGTSAQLNAVYALDATHVYAAGVGGVITKYDGSSWTTMASGTVNALNAIWASAPDDIWAVGIGGTIQHYNGSAWSTSISGTGQTLNGVWGAGQDVFAVGATGTILHYNGTSWLATPQPASLGFVSVWGNSADDVIALSPDAMLHYDGTHWAKVEPALAGATDVHLFDHAHGVVLTADGRILDWDGEAVTGTAPLDGPTLSGRDIWGTSSTDVYAATQGGLWHYNGVAWSMVDSLECKTIWGMAANDVFVGGNFGIRHFNGSTWTDMPMPSELQSTTVRGLWGFASQDVYAVTDEGDVLHYDGQWTAVFHTPADEPLTGVWGASLIDMWVVGIDIMIHFDGTTWTVVESAVRGYDAIWGTADNDIYVVGPAGVARHYDGTAWSPITLPNQTRELRTVHGTSSSDVFIGGDGTLQHFDGTTWTPVTTGVDNGTQDTVGSVWASMHDIAVLGGDATAHFIVRACATCL